MLQRVRLLSTLVFLVVMGAGLVFVMKGAISPSGQKLAAQWQWGAIFDGRFTAKIDKAVVSWIPSSEALNGFVDGGLYALTGDAGPQVRAGCPGWLFLAEELVEVPGAQDHLLERARLAAAIAADMKTRGIALIVVPVPDKAELASEQGCGLAASDRLHERPGHWKAASADLALEQVDVVPNWPKPGYWRTDTHWDRIGAQFAARRVGEAVERTLGSGGDTIVLSRAQRPVERPGDLMRLANLERTAHLFGPAPDTEVPETAGIERTGGLLDDVPSPSVLLAGSSYSLNSGFIDYLQAELSREVIQKSLAGGGFAGAMLELLKSDKTTLKDVRAIVWEWPIRALDLPLTDDEKRYLRDHS